MQGFILCQRGLEKQMCAPHLDCWAPLSKFHHCWIPVQTQVSTMNHSAASFPPTPSHIEETLHRFTAFLSDATCTMIWKPIIWKIWFGLKVLLSNFFMWWIRNEMIDRDFLLDFIGSYVLNVTSHKFCSLGEAWDWPPGAEVGPSGGGVKGKLQGLNSFTVWAGGQGSTSGRQRPEQPEPGKENPTGWTGAEDRWREELRSAGFVLRSPT